MTAETRPTLFELYKLAIDEYHFQVSINWTRTQYHLGLNVAVIAAGTGILELGGVENAALLTASFFTVGLVIVVFSLFATSRQHAYYRATRDRLKSIEQALQLEEAYTIRTTSGFKGEPRRGLRRRLTVNNVTYLVFVVLGLADVAALIYLATL